MPAKWFCRKCWREGLLTGNWDSLKAEAKSAHQNEVKQDMAADKIPAGLDPNSSHSPMMEHYKAVFCPGEIRIGNTQKRKDRFDKATPTALNLDQADPIKL